MGKKIIEKIFWVAVALTVFVLSVNTYSGMKGNPVKYFEAVKAVEDYVSENYDDKLIVGEAIYSWKFPGYNVLVTEKEDSRNTGYISYSKKSIYDDYCFRVKMKMEDELAAMLSTLVRASKKFDTEDYLISVGLELPNFKYSLSDNYDFSVEPVVSINLNKGYGSKEDFFADSQKILNSIYKSSIDFNTITIESFLPDDGNKCYILDITESSGNSFEALEDNVIIKEYKK